MIEVIATVIGWFGYVIGFIIYHLLDGILKFVEAI